MKKRICFINVDLSTQRVIKRWYDSNVFDTVEEAALAAQTAIRCSQNLIKRGVVFYRIVLNENE